MTKLINHFLINDSWYLVDLPGYGCVVMVLRGSRCEHAASWMDHRPPQSSACKRTPLWLCTPPHARAPRFAKTASKEARSEWLDFTKDYFLKRDALAHVLLLVDGSLPPQQVGHEACLSSSTVSPTVQGLVLLLPVQLLLRCHPRSPHPARAAADVLNRCAGPKHLLVTPASGRIYLRSPPCPAKQVDVECVNWLAECQVPFAIVFTKVRGGGRRRRGKGPLAATAAR